jgi:DNA-binding response OmpR family regulator
MEEIKPFVLFADDTPDILQMLRVAANLRGWQVKTASSAEEMIDEINSVCDRHGRCFDLVVADINFRSEDGKPALDGVSALRQIRKKYPDLPFIFLSAWLEPLTTREAKKLNAATEEKPINPNEFLDRAYSIIQFTAQRYEGKERRRRSLNMTEHRRRTSDRDEIEVPAVLRDALEHAARAIAQRKAHG